MSLITNIDKLKLINTEIKNKQTGNPQNFAKKLTWVFGIYIQLIIVLIQF